MIGFFNGDGKFNYNCETQESFLLSQNAITFLNDEVREKRKSLSLSLDHAPTPSKLLKLPPLPFSLYFFFFSFSLLTRKLSPG